MKNKKMLMIIGGLLVVLLGVIWATYAWFQTTVPGNNNASSVVAKSGTLSLTYTNGNEIKGENIIPGWSEEKTFTVENTGDNDVYYKIKWDSLTNTFVNTTDLTYTLTGTTNGSNTPKALTNGVVPTTNDSMVALDGIKVSSGETHTWTMNVTYNNRNADQSSDLGKVLKGKIIIEESARTIDLEGTAMYNGSPVAYGIVESHSDVKRTTTDANGNYTLKEVPLGTHTLYVKDNAGTTLGSTSIKIEEGTVEKVETTGIVAPVAKSKIVVNLTATTNGTMTLASSFKLYDEILKKEGGTSAINAKGTPDFSYTNAGCNQGQTSCTSTNSSKISNGMYKTPDNLGTSYYYRGSVTNNYVSFAGLTWRIIRTNGDGTIRIITNIAILLLLLEQLDICIQLVELMILIQQ